MDLKPADQIGLFEALYSTRALRRFTDQPVSDEVLFQVIDAAIRAPAGSNMQVWHFLIVRDEAKRQRIGELYWQTWTDMSRKAMGMQEPMPSPWEQALDHWWLAVSPSVPDAGKGFMYRRRYGGGWYVVVYGGWGRRVTDLDRRALLGLINLVSTRDL